MNNFIIDIYKQVWDEEWFGPKEDIHLKTFCYQLAKEMNEFSKEIHSTIGYGKGDGFSVNLVSVGSVIFVRIELFGTSEYSFITDYLRENGKEIDYPDIDFKKRDNLIQIPRFDEKLAEELIKELNNEFGQQLTITQSQRIFEKGASDWSVDVLLWLSSIPASVIGSYVYDFLKRKNSERDNEVKIIDSFDKDYVLREAAKLSEVNINDLKLIKFDYNEYKGTTTYFITSRYVDIQLTLVKSNKVVNYRVDKKTQLNI
jgi:hypothetical protein